MTTKAVVAVSALAAAAIAAAAAFLLPSASPSRAPAVARPVTVRAAFEPAAVEFGDLVTARVVVTLDTRAVRASTAHVVYDIAPLTQLGRALVSNSARGGVAVRTYDVRAACLSDACLKRVVKPGTVRVDVARRGRGARASATTTWVPLSVAGRVTRADLAPSIPPFRAPTALPATSYRISPSTLEILLAGLAAVFAGCGVALAVVSAALRRRRAPADERPGELARALLLLRAAQARPEPDRRSTLGYVARLITRRSAPLASTADALAWSRPAPTPDSLTEFAAELERQLPS